MTENNEAALTTTIKIGGGKDDPWIVIRSRDAAHLQSQLMELGDGSAAGTLGQVTATVAAHYRVGKALDAAPLAPQSTNGSNAPAAPASQPQRTPPAQHQAPQAPPQQPQQPAQQAQQPPMHQQSMQQPQAPQAQPQQPPTQQGQVGWPAHAHQNPWQDHQQPVQQPSGLAPEAPMPNAPMVMLANGPQPARFQSGSGSKGPWRAFFDPRQPHELASIPIDPQTNRRQQTDDPNHPGLAGGTHEFCMWLR